MGSNKKKRRLANKAARRAGEETRMERKHRLHREEQEAARSATGKSDDGKRSKRFQGKARQLG